MIGYLKIYKPELKYKEYLVYNSYYCGICKALGDRYGLIYRNLINYDSVFIAVILDSINGYKSDYEKFRCILHPAKKKSRCCKSGSIDYAADLIVLLTYEKLKDNVNDENDFLSKAGSSVMKKKYELSKKRLGDISVLIEQNLEKLMKLEKDNSENIDETAGCYGEIIKGILAWGLTEDSKSKKQTEWLGYNIGKWIYILDAFEDIETDMKKGLYNPILKRFRQNTDNPVEIRNNVSERIAFLLYASLDDAAKAYELIDKKINSGIIKNILYEGLYSITEKVLNGDCINGATESI